jgi:hypothetical protein
LVLGWRWKWGEGGGEAPNGITGSECIPRVKMAGNPTRYWFRLYGLNDIFHITARKWPCKLAKIMSAKVNLPSTKLVGVFEVEVELVKSWIWSLLPV